MTTLVIALVGTGMSAWLARLARRFAVVDRLRVSGTQWVPPPLRVPLARALTAAGVDRSPEHVIQLWLLAALLAGLVGAVFGAPIAVIAVVAVVGGGPFVLRAARVRRAHARAVAVPELLERVAAELRAGGTVATAIAALARADGPLRSDFTRVRSRVDLGAPLPDALTQWSHERAVPGARWAAGALAVAHEVGGRSAESLDSLAASLRARLAVVAETHALSAQARYSALVVGLAPLAYIAFSALVDRRSVEALVAMTGGRLCLAAGLGLELAGALWMRRILHSGAAA